MPAWEPGLLESASQPPNGNTSVRCDVQLYYLLKSDYLGHVERRVPYKLSKEQDAF